MTLHFPNLNDPTFPEPYTCVLPSQRHLLPLMTLSVVLGWRDTYNNAATTLSSHNTTTPQRTHNPVIPRHYHPSTLTQPCHPNTTMPEPCHPTTLPPLSAHTTRHLATHNSTTNIPHTYVPHASQHTLPLPASTPRGWIALLFPMPSKLFSPTRTFQKMFSTCSQNKCEGVSLTSVSQMFTH